MDILLLVLILVIVLALFGGFVFTKLLWIIILVAVLVILFRALAGRNSV